jgi:hypothetical protein
MNDNYFRVTEWRDAEHRTVMVDVFPFDGNDRVLTANSFNEAYRVASKPGRRLVAFRAPYVRGAWDSVPLVGISQGGEAT